MSAKRAVELLHSALDLCGKVLHEETDPRTIAGMRGVVGELEAVIRLIEQDRPAIPMNDNRPVPGH